MQIDNDYLIQTFLRLVNTPSPTGDTQRGTDLCREILCDIDDGLDIALTRKGVLTATLQGRHHDAPRAVSAHIDTIGAIVRHVKPNGRLGLHQIGNFPWTSIENEGVTIPTNQGNLRGSVMIEAASYHIHDEDKVEDRTRSERSIEVRLDARLSSADEVRNLGIEVGTSVYFDPRPEVINGFIRSRFLDDKACLACLFAAVKSIYDAGKFPAQRTTLHIANYEEVCHGGASGVPDDVAEFLSLDVAPTGPGQASDEFSCTLCVADADGPYDAEMNRNLQRIARKNDITLKTDIFPKFSSDAKALWKAGADLRCALIGPGVDATHGYERTHMAALEATARLIALYLSDS